MPEYTDYFTDDDFRSISGDTSAPYKYPPEDVERAQKEIIDRVERWAKTSWKLRDRTETHRKNAGLLNTKRGPIVELISVTLNGDLVSEDILDVNEVTGTIRWGNWSPGPAPYFPAGYTPVVVTYTYGFNEDIVPQGIMRPMIQAVTTLLDGEENRSSLPRNTTKYSTERTDISMGRRGSVQPFPWDPRATDDIRGYWDPYRIRNWITSVA